MTHEKSRVERFLKALSLIFVYSSFLTPWLTQTFLPNVDIRFRYVFGDLVIRLVELPPNVSRTYLDSSPNHILLIMLLVLEMLFIWLSMGRFKQKSGTLEVAAAILGIIPVTFTALNFLKVGFSSPQDFQMTLQPGFFFALCVPPLLLINYVMRVTAKREG